MPLQGARAAGQADAAGSSAGAARAASGGNGGASGGAGGGMLSASAAQLATILGGTLVGAGEVVVRGFAPIEHAGPSDLTFIRSDRYVNLWGPSRAGVAIVSRSVTLPKPGTGRAFVVVPDADLAMATLMNLVRPPEAVKAGGVHASAVVDAGVLGVLAGSVHIGPGCVVGAGCEFGERVVLHARVTVGANVRIGAGSVLHPGVVIYDGCVIGERVTIHSNAVIGADGFGYRPNPTGGPLVKMPHNSHVELGDDVEIGAGTCIDRGKMRPTQVGAGTKIDNLVQVGHGVRIGRHTLIAGCTGIAGSVTIGDHVMIGGQCGIADNLTIHDNVRIAALAGVMNDIPAGETWFGIPAVPARQAMRQLITLQRLAGSTPRKTFRAVQNGEAAPPSHS